MGWHSLLPARLTFIETAVQYICITIGIIIIGPWILIFGYDFVLYLWRTATYDIPIIGGAARGKQRPRAPTLLQRPDGHRRRFSLAAISIDLASHTTSQQPAVIEEEDDEYESERNDSIIGSPPTESTAYRRRKSLLTWDPDESPRYGRSNEHRI